MQHRLYFILPHSLLQHACLIVAIVFHHWQIACLIDYKYQFANSKTYYMCLHVKNAVLDNFFDSKKSSQKG